MCIIQLTTQLALAGLAEFFLHLTRMNPDMMYLHQDSGFLNISYFKFDIDDQGGSVYISFLLFFWLPIKASYKWGIFCKNDLVFSNIKDETTNLKYSSIPYQSNFHGSAETSMICTFAMVQTHCENISGLVLDIRCTRPKSLV